MAEHLEKVLVADGRRGSDTGVKNRAPDLKPDFPELLSYRPTTMIDTTFPERAIQQEVQNETDGAKAVELKSARHRDGQTKEGLIKTNKLYTTA